MYPNGTNSTIPQSLQNRLTEGEQLGIVVVRTVGGSLSLLGSLFILFSMVWFRRLRHMSSRLIFMLATMSFFDGTADVLTFPVWFFEDPENPSALCWIQAVTMQFSQIAEFGWITIIAINLYLVVAYYKDTYKYEAVYHFLVWVFALLCTLVPVFKNGAYGFAGFWCWITSGEGQIYRWVFFYVPLFIMWVVVIILYALILKAVKVDTPLTQERKKAKRLNILLRAYPAIFVFLYSFALVNRIYNAFNFIIFFFELMQSLTAPFLGFFNAIAYGLDDYIQSEWYKTCCRLPCCSSSPKTTTTTIEWDKTYLDSEEECVGKNYVY